MPPFKKVFLPLLALLFLIPLPAFAAPAAPSLDLTDAGVGYIALVLFSLAYLLVMAEEFTHLRKSKPVIICAGVIWAMIGYVYTAHGHGPEAEAALRHNLLEFSELFLFLLAAMTYVNSMDERQIFEALRSWLVNRGFGYRSLFWSTGVLSFLISPVLDNLTTALVTCAVLMAVGKGNARFVSLGCINIVIAANAGGAFSPFGDITTLMVWQKGHVSFSTFFALFLPALTNFVVPALLMHMAVPRGMPEAAGPSIPMRRGAGVIMLLFGFTIATAVCFHQFLHLPPMLGMMTGLGYLQVFGFYLKKTHKARPDDREDYGSAGDVLPMHGNAERPFDVFGRLARAEWDTLLFFYGVVLSVGGLAFMGYLGAISHHLYVDLGPSTANILVGVLSAVVDNIPVMFAVLTMNPDMSTGQWLLVTLTAGVGGSLLSIGSAAGVALMGQARGAYTFFGHLKWTPAILLGYAAGIGVHMLVNARYF